MREEYDLDKLEAKRRGPLAAFGTEPAHPFRWLPSPQRRAVFVVTLTTALLLAIVLVILGGDLKTTDAPGGIICFELAGDLATAEQIISSWGDTGRTLAAFHLGIDYLFLVLYPLAISLGCSLIVVRLAPGFRPWVLVGGWLAWAQLLAGLLDFVENWALISLLFEEKAAWLPVIAFWCAAIKFALVGAGLCYLACSLVIVLLARKAPRELSDESAGRDRRGEKSSSVGG